MIEIIPYSDAALLINFEQKISPEINKEVIQLNQQIEKANIPGIHYLTPAYCSITIGFDPQELKFDFLKDLILTIFNSKKKEHIIIGKRKWLIPVCYESQYSLDLDELEEQLKISKEEIIYLHTENIFQVYMLGFLPGFPYMGTLPPQLNCTRKETPRLKVPARSVGLAGLQTGIYPMEAPGGWQIIGRTPISIFDSRKDHPFLLKAGDEVQFYKVDEIDFMKIESEWQSGTFNLKNIYG